MGSVLIVASCISTMGMSHIKSIQLHSKRKGTVIPLQARCGPEGG